MIAEASAGAEVVGEMVGVVCISEDNSRTILLGTDGTLSAGVDAFNAVIIIPG